MRKSLLVLSFAVLSFAPAWATHDHSSSAPGPAVPAEPGFRGGVVAVSHPLAAEAGARMLRNGGNAIDAAAAIQFALNVVEPEFSGIGGGGFMMVHLAKGKGKTFVFEGREKAPASADTTLFTNPDGTPPGIHAGVDQRPGGGRARHPDGRGHGRAALREQAPVRGDPARDRARRERLPGELRARRQRDLVADQPLPGHARRVPSRRRAGAGGPDPEAAGPREDAAADREEGTGCLLPRRDRRGDRGGAARVRHRRQARPDDAARTSRTTTS